MAQAPIVNELSQMPGAGPVSALSGAMPQVPLNGVSGSPAKTMKTGLRGMSKKSPIKNLQSNIAKPATRLSGRPLNAQKPFGADTAPSPLAKTLSGQ